MAGLTSKQQGQVTEALQDTEHDVISDWDPDLVIEVDGVQICFHAEDRSITVADDIKLDGANHKGRGFVTKMVEDALAALPSIEAPSSDPDPEPKKAKPKGPPPVRVPAPPPPKRTKPIFSRNR